MKRIGLLMAMLVGALAAGAAKQPNILFILTDDQGYGDIGRHGHPVLDTPNMDRLHDESVRFDNFYVSPSCSPTRAALMTGMHEFRNGVTHTLEPREHLSLEATILPQLLKTAGYKTGFIGKWHLSNNKGYAPGDRGFDWCATNPMGPRKHFDVEIIRNNKRFPTKGFREDVYFDECMTFIDECGDQPWFMYLCTYSPHTPLDAPADLIAKYQAKGLNAEHATYMAMIENIDQNLGRLTDFLKKRKLDKDTIVMFINDNGVTKGLDVYNAGMRGCKATCWEGGTRAMSFWKWPGQWKPQTVDSLTAHLDVLPTLCEIAGAKIPAELQSELQGYSLLPLLNSKGWKHDDRILYHNVGRWPSGTAASHKHAMCSVRKGNLLLVRSAECDNPECEKYQSQCTTMRAVRRGLKTTTYANGTAQTHWGVTPVGHWALFDVKKDPACLNDVSAAHPEHVASMIASYDKWWDEQYPVMIARGGDAGDPDASKNAASRARQHAAMVKAQKKAKAPKATPKATKAQGSMFERLDADGNQKVTKEEYLALFVPMFPHKDTDGDGLLTPEEFPYAGSFKAGDTDNDGKLTPAEFESMYGEQFHSRDANGDGVVSPDEM
ncbi:sulfatase-like hydrolase/transferase [Pontiellaceae bacterium B12227]|nr:sulfatase-like hydrolase/transferase [Pontiellaceae bacterium B12227]